MNDTPLPHSLDGERAILSCILLDGPLSLAKAIDGKIDENSFYDPIHRKVWKTIQWLHRHNQPLELSILADELKKKGLLEEVGGVQGLIDCTKAIPTTAEVSYWIEEVRKCYVMREVYATSLRMQERVMARSGNVPDFVQEMNSLLTLHHASSKHTTLAEAANDAAATVDLIERGEYKQEDAGHTWPWPDWTKTFGLARPGELIILSARPSIGKSSASRQIAWHWAQSGHVLLFSREMNAKAIAPLIAQVNTGVSWRAVVNGHARQEELATIKSELGKLARFKNLTVYDADRTLAHIVTRVKAVAQTQPIKAIVIDYLQRYDPQQERGETRDVALGRFTMAMKDLAVDLGIPVLLLAQVGRAVERENREPRMSDLRESGNIEQDADKIIFLHAPEHRPDGSPQNLTDNDLRYVYVDCIQAKGRNDGMGRAALMFERRITRFDNYSAQ